MARHGGARWGKARIEARRGMEHGSDRLGGAWWGKEHGEAGRGKARRGSERGESGSLNRGPDLTKKGMENMGPLLLTDSHLQWLRGGLDRAIFYDSLQDCLVKGAVDHSGGGEIVLRPDDCQQLDWDLDACSGVVLHRLDQIFKRQEDNDILR